MGSCCRLVAVVSCGMLFGWLPGCPLVLVYLALPLSCHRCQCTITHTTLPKHTSGAHIRFWDADLVEFVFDMFSTLARKAAQGATPRLSAEYIKMIRERYPPKKVWPPDFKSLSPQEQLMFEKKYKRRLAMKSARPKWEKLLKLAQLFSVTST
jgi:hypothetical protein